MDKVTFGSSSFILVTKSDGLSATTPSAIMSVPSQRNCSIARSASSAEIPSQGISLRPGDQRRLSGTQIRFVIADQKDAKLPSSAANAEPTTLQLFPSNPNKAFCATPLTNSVTILPGSAILPRNSVMAQAPGGRVLTPVISQGTVKGGTSTVTVIPVNIGKTPQKLSAGNNIMVPFVSRGNESSAWSKSSATLLSSSATSLAGAKSVPSFSPNKLVIQFSSNQLPLLQQQQPRPVVPSQQRLSGGQQLVPGATFATVPNPQFVQLVAASQLQMKGGGTDKLQTLVLPASSAVGNTSGRNKSTTIGHQQSIAAKSNGSMQTSTTQRLILPATSQHVQLNVAMAGTNLFQTVPSSVGATVAYISGTVNHPNLFVPTHHPIAQASANHHPKSTMEFHSASSAISTSHSSSETSSKHSAVRQLHWPGTEAAGGPRPRKPCNCTKSQCLKLYCECFANSEFCNDCNCCNCFNNYEHEEERGRAIKSCLERNPSAFHPKIGKGGSVRQHNKGCNCKRSGCLKNYCECYEAKILCSHLCRCVGCQNFEESPDGQTLLQLADAAEVRVQQQTAAETKLSSQIIGPPVRPPSASWSGERLPYTFMTLEVVEAVSSCLLTDAEAREKSLMQLDDAQQERQMLLEFGRCLTQIIQTASKTRPATPSQP